MIKLFIHIQKLLIYIADKSVIITIIRRTRRAMAVKSAIRHADKMRRMRRGRQQFVIQIGKKVRVYEREQINNLIKAGWLDKALTNYLELCKYCIYINPSASDPVGKKNKKSKTTVKAK